MTAEKDLKNPNVEPEPWVDGAGFSNGWWFCKPCGEWKPNGGPGHVGSSFCRSGKRPHCTCDLCF